jgi:ubiquinone/menaquinone biosynthesis C-methylase UbiE
MIRTSDKKHWDDFWDSSGKVGEVYDNEGRVSRHFMSVAPLEGMRILEVGAGTGRDGLFMANMGASVVSLDYSLSSLGIIREQIPEGVAIDLCCADAFSLPFYDDTFDLVFHQGLLEHFRNPEDMIEEHHRVLRPGGYILVDVPQKYHYYTVLKKMLIMLGRWFAGWETQYSPRELETMLKRSGFRIVTTYGEWLNPPIWYRMMRKLFYNNGIKLPMHPRIFRAWRKLISAPREGMIRLRPVIYTTVVIGSIGKKKEGGDR